jgi:hypothetical protein
MRKHSGYATDGSYSLIEKRIYIEMDLTSDQQAEAIATALIHKAQLNAHGGSGAVPINLGQELYDYINIIDIREGDEVQGNVGWISEHINPRNNRWNMTIGFGNRTNTSILKELVGISDQGQEYESETVKNFYNDKIETDHMQSVKINELEKERVYTITEAGIIVVEKDAWGEMHGWQAINKITMEADTGVITMMGGYFQFNDDGGWPGGYIFGGEGTLVLAANDIILGGTEVSIEGDVDMNASQIHELADPDDAQDAATKHYVDEAIANAL